jgi:hypothetical protein
MMEVLVPVESVAAMEVAVRAEAKLVVKHVRKIQIAEIPQETVLQSLVFKELVKIPCVQSV